MMMAKSYRPPRYVRSKDANVRKVSPYPNFPILYDQPVEIFPEKPWLKVSGDYRQLERQFPLRGTQRELENSITLGLTYWEKFKYQPPTQLEWNAVKDALEMTATVLALNKKISNGEHGPRDIIARFRSGFTKPDNMRALQFELSMAHQLSKSGCAIFWPDESKGNETYDMFVTPPNSFKPFELECKSFSSDKGSTVTLETAASIAGACMHGGLNQFTASPNKTTVISITIKRTPPKKKEEFEQMIKELGENFKLRTESDNDVLVLAYDVMDTDGCPTNESFYYNAASRLPGAIAFVLGVSPEKNTHLVLRILASSNDKIWKEIKETAKAAADRQLTSKHPGIIAMQLNNISIESLVQRQYDARIWGVANRLLSREHVAMTVVTSAMERRAVDSVQDSSIFAVNCFEKLMLDEPASPKTDYRSLFFGRLR